jgi:mono/diheme cytochrome c family protein
MSLASVAALSACGGGGGASGGTTEASAAESSGGGESEYAGEIASADIEKGKTLYGTYCDDCHPDGGSDVGPSLIDDPHPAPALRKQIREGSGKMKPISEKRLKNEDMEAILAYLDSIKAVKH